MSYFFVPRSFPHPHDRIASQRASSASVPGTAGGIFFVICLIWALKRSISCRGASPQNELTDE